MWHAFKQLDLILRGEATQLPALKAGRIDIPITGLTGAIALLGVFYGACVGSYAVIHIGGEHWKQLIAGAVKLPLLFFLTLLVTFPSLYVFNALVGSRLSIVSVLRLLIAMLGVMLAVLASLGPIVVFFAISTDNYAFMILLNVVLASVAGFLGLAFLLRTLHRLVVVQEALAAPAPVAASPGKADVAEAEQADEPPTPETKTEPQSQPEPEPGQSLPPPSGEASDDTARRMAEKQRTLHPPPLSMDAFRGALDQGQAQTDRRARAVFRNWVIVFALVGAQMSWVLRPFIGASDLPFEWFREREGNFFLAVLVALGELLGRGT